MSYVMPSPLFLMPLYNGTLPMFQAIYCSLLIHYFHVTCINCACTEKSPMDNNVRRNRVEASIWPLASYRYVISMLYVQLLPYFRMTVCILSLGFHSREFVFGVYRITAQVSPHIFKNSFLGRGGRRFDDTDKIRTNART